MTMEERRDKASQRILVLLDWVEKKQEELEPIISCENTRDEVISLLSKFAQDSPVLMLVHPDILRDLLTSCILLGYYKRDQKVELPDCIRKAFGGSE